MSNDVAQPTPEDKARYDKIKEELKHALQRKRDVDKKLAQIEVKIYNLETTYLTETTLHSGGNIIHGFEGYLKNVSSGRRKHEVSENDRIFSNSSETYKKALELAGEGEDSAATGEEPSRTSTPALTTVVVPPARQELTAAQNKKVRDREYQRKKRANARRSAALSDDESVTSASSRRPTKRARMADDD
ncbi:NuA4-domain-containing protein [Panus rudis PR-1116 ss-1]|nr:NuA4-domain-containing protein [Panus rudis PR-1116 ss-1]